MAEEVIQARHIELLDAEEEPSLILEGTNEKSKAGLRISSVEENSPMVTLNIDLERGHPYLLLRTKPEGAAALITFVDGEPVLLLRNDDGSERTITP